MNLTRVITIGAAAALLAPAAAHGAVLQTDLPCYIEGQAMGVAGSGWGPGTAWSVRADQIFASGTADEAGNFVDTTQVKAPTVSAETTKPTTVTLTGQQDGTDVASTTFKVVNFLVDPKDPSGKPTRSTSWRFSGFNPGKAIYIHVSRKGRTYTQKAGVAKSPCGTLTKRLRRLPAVPARKIAYGKYKIAVDNRKKYAKPNGQYNQYTATITIYKTFL
jgi:hypothetical protein